MLLYFVILRNSNQPPCKKAKKNTLIREWIGVKKTVFLVMVAPTKKEDASLDSWGETHSRREKAQRGSAKN